MRKLILILVVVTPLLAGCQRSERQDKNNGPNAPGNAAAPAQTPPANGPATTPGSTPGVTPGGTAPAAPGSPATGTPTAAPVPPGQPAPADKFAPSPSAPEWREVVIPAGTQLEIEMETSVGSDISHVEDPVRAALVDNVTVHGTTALPAGSTVTGTVTNAKRPGKVKGVAELGIRFDTIRPKDGDASYHVRTGVVTRRGRATRQKDTLTIVGPAAGGALLGGLLGGKKGALIGTTVGGGAGTAVVLTTRGKELRLPRGTRLTIRLIDPLTVRVRA
jgi:hypothetical protein